MENLAITKQGLENLQNELKELKTVERPNITKAIAEAREHGDLKENAEYHSAREKQGFIEARIANLEDKLARAVVVVPSEVKDDKILFGATVIISDLNTEQEFTYQIVSEYEANIDKNLISISSPIARVLLGKKIGDEAILKLPKGDKEYEIIDVKYV